MGVFTLYLGESLLDYLFRIAFPSYKQQETKNQIPSQNGCRPCCEQSPLSGSAKIGSHLKNNNQICQVVSAFSCGSFGGDHRDHSEPEGQRGRLGLWRRSAGAIVKDKRFSHRKQCSKEQSSTNRSLLIKL